MPSLFTLQPAARWDYVKLAKAEAACWNVVRGKYAVFDVEWSPRMEVFGSGI